MNGMENKKMRKKRRLTDAAYQLFMNDGFQNTSIDDIAKLANVAKGTFYLYFHDKFDIMNTVALNISCKVLADAHESMVAHRKSAFAENVIMIADYIIEYFHRNPLVLKLVEKNFSWPLIREQLSEEQDNQLKSLLDEFCSQRPNHGREESFKLLFLVIELCGSISYASIIHQQPDTIENMKPFLYDAIRRLLA